AGSRQRLVDAGHEHLHEIVAGRPAGRDVKAVRLGPELRIEGQGHLLVADHEDDRVLRVVRPAALGVQRHESLQADLARAGGHAARLHGHAVAERVVALDARVAGDAFLAHAGGRPVHRLLVWAGLDALAVAAAARLVDEHDAVLRALVDRLARTGGQAGGGGAGGGTPAGGDKTS